MNVIKNMVLANSGNDDDANDVFQEAMVVLYRKVREDGFKLTSTLNTFLYSIAKLVWLKELENRKKRPARLEEFHVKDEIDKDDINKTIIYNERQKLFKRVFNQLSEDCKRVLTMFLNGLAIAEITRIMGYSSDQHTKNRRFRCKKSLISKIRETSDYKELSDENNQLDRDIPRW